jgi:acetyl-CoA carboxylase carboxyltransferase component
MAVSQSQIKTSDPEYRSRFDAYAVLVEDLRRRWERAQAPGPDEAVQAARKKGKFLVAERIELLIDPGSPLLELSPFAGVDVYPDLPAGSGIGLRSCIGRIHNRTCMIVANDPTIKGGTYFPLSVRKHIRAQEAALQNALPCIYLVDSGGAYLPLQAEVFPDRHHFGRIFYNQAVLSSRGIPQLAAVLGSCTAGGAYVPAMSEETVMVRGNATIFLGGPPLVKAATGEDVTAEELGGADVHCRKSGVADHFAENEEEAILRIREAIFHLDRAADLPEPLRQSQQPEEPLYDPSEIYGIVGTDLKKAFPMLEVIARLVDGSRFAEFKRDWGSTLRCGFAHIFGFSVGIIANDGILFSESALKAAHFIELCNQRRIPLLFIQNIVGFMVGKQYEENGIAKHGAKMVAAVATARVPKLTLILGASYGAGNYGMCGRAYDPHFLFSWPGSRISVMGGQQAAEVLTQVRFGESRASAEATQHRDKILQKYEAEGSAYYASARMWDDGVIEPIATRRVLSLALAASRYPEPAPGAQTFFRM